MDTARDLACADPWHESLERSRARRRQPPKRRRGLLRPNFWAIGAVAVLAVAVPNVLANHGNRPATANRAALQRPAGSPPAVVGSIPASWRRRAAPQAHVCVPVRVVSGYVNPLVRARVKAERVDQGVDYAGTGTLAAIGEAKLLHVDTDNTGWPGAFVEYQLLGGPDAGCFVYYAEGIEPVANLRPGEVVHAGQAIATIISGWSTGIELGWGAGINTTSLAMQNREWTAQDDDNNKASSAGKSFSALISSLGGPAGKVEG